MWTVNCTRKKVHKKKRKRKIKQAKIWNCILRVEEDGATKIFVKIAYERELKTCTTDSPVQHRTSHTPLASTIAIKWLKVSYSWLKNIHEHVCTCICERVSYKHRNFAGCWRWLLLILSCSCSCSCWLLVLLMVQQTISGNLNIDIRENSYLCWVARLVCLVTLNK